MQNENVRLKEILDAEFMWSEKDCEAVVDYLIANGLGFVDDVRREWGRIIASKALIINDLHEEVKLLEKENELLWRKQKPIPMDGDKCPVCGRMQFIPASGYCKKCGQALVFEDTHSPSVRARTPNLDKLGSKTPSAADSSLPEGTLTGDDIELLTNLNDRS